jgi:hypothetical protein
MTTHVSQKIDTNVNALILHFFFWRGVGLGFELRHLEPLLLCILLWLFEMGSYELFACIGFEPQSSESPPPK